MSKFCGTCGAQMDDSARVCGNCGAVLAAAPNAYSNMPQNQYPGMPQNQYPGMPQNQGTGATGINKLVESVKGFFVSPNGEMQTKKIITAAVAVVLAVVIIVVGVTAITKNTGYNAILKKAMNAYADNDPDALSKLEAEFVDTIPQDKHSSLSEFGPKDLKDLEKVYKELLDADMKDFDSKMDNDDYKITYKITDVSEMSNRAAAEMLVSYMTKENNKQVSEDDAKDSFKQVKKAKVKVTANKKGGKKKKTITKIVYVVKDIDGNWGLIDIQDKN